VECQVILEHQVSRGTALVTEWLVLGGRQDPVTPTCKYLLIVCLLARVYLS